MQSAKLKIAVEIKINSRKILSALAEICGDADKMVAITVAIDKLDKIGIEKVTSELAEKGLNEEEIRSIGRYLAIEGNNAEKLEAVAREMKRLERQGLLQRRGGALVLTDVPDLMQRLDMEA